MSAVLRAYGEAFDVDRFLAESQLRIITVKRRGEPVHPRTQPDGRRRTRSGVHISASEADFDQFELQIQDAIKFLKENETALRHLCGFPSVDVTLNFGISRRDVICQVDNFPAELVRLAGALGMSIELTQYPTGLPEPPEQEIK
jgi:hypothetical protein